MNGSLHSSNSTYGSSLIFISGGVRSGKSRFAEQLALEMVSSQGGQLCYIATGVGSDREMNERILKHRKDRESAKYHWRTIEKSISIGEIASQLEAEDVILLDCVTTLLNNELFLGEQDAAAVVEKICTGITLIKSRVKALVVVSNEVLNELFLGNTLTFTYGRLLGQIHQYLVKEADQAYLVEAGVPILMKGVTL